jgi:hypothetical protein
MIDNTMMVLESKSQFLSKPRLYYAFIRIYDFGDKNGSSGDDFLIKSSILMIVLELKSVFESKNNILSIKYNFFICFNRIYDFDDKWQFSG